MKTKNLWLGFISVIVLSFAVLGYYGYEIYLKAPPIPGKIVTVNGTVLFTAQDIKDGQNVWQSMGGQEVGTVWGHGAYQAPDWSADWLHREAMYILNRWSNELYKTDYEKTSDENKAVLQVFKKDIALLNVLPPSVYCKATDFIKEQIEMVECLDKKGYTYKTNDGIYYDTSKFPEYGRMALLDVEGLEEGRRIAFSDEKKSKTDFALWKFSPKDQKRQMEWESPYGTGFPGWHIECSAMSIKFLGKHFDIHCGGVDHIPIHHTNEIAQAEACTGEKFVNYWLHGEFLIEEKGKMSKSAGEFLRLQTLIDKGYSPLDYRYFLLMTHYRKKIRFSFDNLDAARNGFNNLKSKIKEVKSDLKELYDVSESDNVFRYREKFYEGINDDLNVSEGLALTWEVLKDESLSAEEKIFLVNDFNKILGLDLDKIEADNIPEEIIVLANKRKEAKANKDFKLSDDIRQQIKALGYELLDKKGGEFDIKKI